MICAIDCIEKAVVMRTKLPTRPKMDERIALVLPADEKRRLFEAAARKNTTVSAMLRAAVAHVAQAA